MSNNYWEEKTLEEMSQQEWEDLCDGCGKCCLEKLEDITTGEVATTRITCRLLDLKTCKCSDYNKRFSLMDDCIKLTAKKVAKIKWLPKTCSYRLIYEGKSLPNWHPLITKNKESTKESGNAVNSFAIHPALADKGLFEYIIDEDI